MARLAKDYKDDTLRPHGYFDYSLLFLTLFLVCFGLVMIYSTSSYTSQVRYGDSMYFLKKQALSAILGIAAMLFMGKVIDYRIIIKKLPIIRMTPATLLYLVSIGLQVLVLFIGEDINGAKRWIKVPLLGSFQPSEISKVATVLFVAYLVYIAPRKLDKMAGLFRIALYIAPLLGLIAKENLSTAIIIAGIFITICFVASRRKWYYIVAALGLVAVGAAFIFLVDYRGERIDVWLNVETHEKGFQILQGLYAIASGGLFGTGLGESMQKLGFIPESHNDMIFAVICEELGLFGAIMVIMLFLLLLWRIFIIAISAPDLFGGLICVGVMAQIAIQVIINIAVVTNSIPSTGIPLPFISYGGTSVAILLAEMGVVLSVSNQITHQRN
ncbi:putative peptidoglycan glycosyltransferase FtsW [Anaerolentibacter hominis]|uniref:FtsW/RodA/SpoVE family cell cycle protein n=1 Tax=Anaerolentibacter hominis TaxID=3079009 RepID=UPI0031B8178C